MSVVIPKGFVPIAIRNEYAGSCTVSFNPDRKEFFMITNGRVSGPFDLNDLKVMKENITDVIQMQGKFLFLTDYNADGTLKNAK